MAAQSQPDKDTGTQAQQIMLGFEDDKFTIGDHEDKREWVATQVRIAEQRATTRNIVSVILVAACVLAFPIYVLALYFLPDLKQDVMTGFSQWLTVIGSLTGAAIGVGAMASRKDS